MGWVSASVTPTINLSNGNRWQGQFINSTKCEKKKNKKLTHSKKIIIINWLLKLITWVWLMWLWGQVNVISPFECRQLKLILTKIAHSCRTRSVCLKALFQVRWFVKLNQNLFFIIFAQLGLRTDVKKLRKHNCLAFPSASLLCWHHDG